MTQKNKEINLENTAFARLFELCNCKTQDELSAILDLSQSAISEAKKRGKIPDSWLLKLVNLWAINPNWIVYGIEPKFLNKVKNKTRVRKIKARLRT